MSNTTTLIERVRQDLPNAEPMMFGNPDPHSAQLEWGDHMVCVTSDQNDSGQDIYLLGIYTQTGWEDGDLPLALVELPDNVDHVAQVLDFLTEEAEDCEADGRDWGAWASLWLIDLYPDCSDAFDA